MAGGLPKDSKDFERIEGSRLAIIGSMWHPQCVEPMIARALSELNALGCTNVDVHHLPGSYELPMAARFLFNTHPDLDAILAFGVVLTGATAHNMTVLQEVTSGFSRVMHDTQKIIINEVIGVDDIEDAVKRSGNDNWNKGLEAVFAVSEVLSWQRKVLKKATPSAA